MKSPSKQKHQDICLARGVMSRSVFAHAATLHRRCVINNEPTTTVAPKMRLELEEVQGMVRLLKAAKRIPTPERLAVVAQLDPGLDDSDVADIFGQTPEWSAWVRQNADAIRASHPLPPAVEWLTEDLQPDSVTALQIADGCRELRNLRDAGKVAGRVMDRLFSRR